MFFVIQNPETQAAMYLEVLYPQVQNFGIFWASGSVVYGTLFRNLNSFRSVATQRSRCRNRPFLPNENENPKSCFSSCEPSKRYESDWICSPNFVGVELSKRNTWKPPPGHHAKHEGPRKVLKTAMFSNVIISMCPISS